MKKMTFSILVIASAIFLTSCNKEKQLSRRLEGVWNLDKIEYTDAEDATWSYSLTNAGTIEFNEDKSGKFNYSYTVNGETYKNSESFKWENTEETVIITGSSNSGDKERIFTVDENDRKQQVWSNTESDGDKTIFTLSKE
jgi:ribosomal protein S4E